jgi:hypothetical protein
MRFAAKLAPFDLMRAPIMKYIAPCVFIAMINVPAPAHSQQDDVELSQQSARIRERMDIVEVAVSAKNISSTMIKDVWIECAALKQGGALEDTGLGHIENLHPGETDYKFITMPRIHSVDFIFRCRVARSDG